MNCPNCGAPINYGHKCEYCGSLYPLEIRNRYINHYGYAASSVIFPENDTYRNIADSIREQYCQTSMSIANILQTQYLLNTAGQLTAIPAIYI